MWTFHKFFFLNLMNKQNNLHFYVKKSYIDNQHLINCNCYKRKQKLSVHQHLKWSESHAWNSILLSTSYYFDVLIINHNSHQSNFKIRRIRRRKFHYIFFEIDLKWYLKLCEAKNGKRKQRWKIIQKFYFIDWNVLFLFWQDLCRMKHTQTKTREEKRLDR